MIILAISLIQLLFLLETVNSETVLEEEQKFGIINSFDKTKFLF